jgi:protein phosphatase
MELMNDTVISGFSTSHSVPQVFSIDGGSIAIFSTRSPDKWTDNEDAYAIIRINPESIVLAVADGAGGYAGGDVAARAAIEALADATGEHAEHSLRAAIVNGFERGHDAIITHSPGAATTLVVAEITEATVRTYHVGDSGVAVVGGRGKLKLQTIFHSPTGYAVESGLISEAQALRHESRHIVSNLLGLAGMSVEIGTPLALAPRDTVLLASDGLYDNLLSDEIAALASGGTIEQACRRLIEAAGRRMRDGHSDQPCKPDDLTVLLYRRGRP